MFFCLSDYCIPNSLSYIIYIYIYIYMYYDIYTYICTIIYILHTVKNFTETLSYEYVML